MTELKPCPFCGSRNIVLTEIHYGIARIGCNTDMCICFYSTTTPYGSKKDAIEAWNRRANNEHNNKGHGYAGNLL